MIFGEVHCSKGAPGCFAFNTMRGPFIYSRFAFDGKCISRARQPTMHGLRHISFFGPDDFIPVNHKGLFAARVRALDDRGLEVNLFLQFDENLDKFTAISKYDGKDRFWADYSKAWWEDTFYGRNFDKIGSASTFWGRVGNM